MAMVHAGTQRHYSEPIGSMHRLYVLFVILFSYFEVSRAQEEYFEGAGVDSTPENSVYLLMVIFFAINFCTPVLAWLWRTYVAPFIDSAHEKLMEVQQRISERLSDAGRKMSDRMRG